MADDFTICIGTIGTGAWLSRDGGESWRPVRTGLWSESRVFGFAVHPKVPRTLLAGPVDGVRRSRDGGESWTRIAGGLNDPDIHDTAVTVNGSKTVLTSTPREIFASTDGGESWRGLGVGVHFRLPYCRSLALKADDPSV